MHPNPIPTATPPAEPVSPTMAAILANARADADRAHQMHDEASDLVDRLYADRRQFRRQLGLLAGQMDERANAAYSPADGQALADFADEVRALRGSIPGPSDSPTGRGGLLAAVRAVIDAGHLSYDGSGVDVDRVQGEAHARLVDAYEAVTGGTVDTTSTVRGRLAAELHRIADDIVRLDLPVGHYSDLHLGVVADRAELERWAEYLGKGLDTPDGTGIPSVGTKVKLGDAYGPQLSVRAQAPKEQRSETERLTARIAELEAQLAAGGTR
jgi:hypothetical protein